MTTDTNNFDEIGDDHYSNSATNPVRLDAFELTDDEKIERIFWWKVRFNDFNIQ